MNLTGVEPGQPRWEWKAKRSEGVEMKRYNCRIKMGIRNRGHVGIGLIKKEERMREEKIARIYLIFSSGALHTRVHCWVAYPLELCATTAREYGGGGTVYRGAGMEGGGTRAARRSPLSLARRSVRECLRARVRNDAVDTHRSLAETWPQMICSRPLWFAFCFVPSSVVRSVVVCVLFAVVRRAESGWARGWCCGWLFWPSCPPSWGSSRSEPSSRTAGPCTMNSRAATQTDTISDITEVT